MADESSHRVLEIPRAHYPIYQVGELSIRMLRKALLEESMSSRQGWSPGERTHPVDYAAAIQLINHNAHHATCIRTKRDSIVGLGFETEYDKKRRAWMASDHMTPPPVMDPTEKSKAQEVLDPLTQDGLRALMLEVTESYSATSNGYIEVVREKPKPGSPLVSLWHVPTPNVKVFVEEANNVADWHWVVRGEGPERHFARFGDLERFRKTDWGKKDPKSISEVIAFREPSAQSPFYGIPSWLSVVPAIELVQMIHQQQFDFFLNRGVPEFMALFIGQTIPEETWAKIDEAVKATIGQGNAHKSIALNLNDREMRVQIEKLAMDAKAEDGFGDKLDSLAMEIVTGHRTPPLLAGIVIPGKLGANNELPNSLIAFQTLYVNQQQDLITDILDRTLGNEEHNAGLGLKSGDFLFRKITDQFNLQELDTMSRMRETAAEAQQQNRDLSEGVKKQVEEFTPEQLGKVLGRMLLILHGEAA